MDFREFNRKCLESFLVGVNGSESILLDFECLVNYEYSVHLENPAHEIFIPRSKTKGKWARTYALFEEGTQKDRLVASEILNSSDSTIERWVLAGKQTNASDFLKCLVTHDLFFFVMKEGKHHHGSYRPHPEKTYVAITNKRAILFSTSWLSRLRSPSERRISSLRQIPFYEFEEVRSTGKNGIVSEGCDLSLQFSQIRGESPDTISDLLNDKLRIAGLPDHKRPVEEQDLEVIQKIGEAYAEFKLVGKVAALAQPEIDQIEKLLSPIIRPILEAHQS